MLRRLVLPSLRRPAAAAAVPLSTTTAAPAAPVPGTSLRQAAFYIIHSAGPGQPLHNREVFRQLEAALPEDVSWGDRWMEGGHETTRVHALVGTHTSHIYTHTQTISRPSAPS